MNTKRFFVFVVFIGFVLLLQVFLAGAQGPSITQFDFDPPNGSNVGQGVTIHFAWTCNPNCGAAKVTVSCGGGDQIENTSGRFDFHWDTNGCQSGGQSVQICTRTNEDQQWTQPNCMSRGYELAGSSPVGQPSVDFHADAYTLSPGNCTTMHWRTSNATSVNIDGNNLPPNGDQQICPRVTTKYSIAATGPGGTVYMNFSIEVGSVNQQQAVNSTQSPQNNNIQPNGGQSQPVQSQPSGSSGGSLSISQAKQNGGKDGGFDLITVAYAWGCQGVHNEGGRWDGWIMDCNGQRKNLTMDDFNLICQQVYGSDYHATLVGNNEGAVKCQGGNNSNPGNANPQQLQPNQNPGLPADCSGVLGPHLVLGQQATVTQAGDGHNLRAGEGTSQPVRGTLHAGETVTVIGGPRCADGYQWWQVQTQSQGTWWVAEAGGSVYWLQAGAVQVAQPRPQPQANAGLIRCDPDTSEDDSVVFVSYHSDSESSLLGKVGIQCGEYVDKYLKERYGFDLKNYRGNVCTSALTKDWVQSAQNCGLTVDRILGNVAVGDIVIWANCPGYVYGHAAVVIQPPSGNTLYVTDANENYDGLIHTSATYQFDSCMYFIHTSLAFGGKKPNGPQPGQVVSKRYPPYPQMTVTWVMASNVNIACVKCNTKNDWVEVQLPHGQYDDRTMGLHLAYLDQSVSIPLTHIEITGGEYDTLRFHLSDSEDLSRVVGSLTLEQLRDTSAWYVTFTHK